MLQEWMDIPLGDDITQSLRRHLRYPDAPVDPAPVPVRMVAPYDFTHTFRVKPPEHGQSVLNLFSGRFPFRSAEGWTQKLHDGLVLVNGLKVSPDHLVRQNDELSHRNIAVVEPAIPDDIRVVFENEHLIVVDKPAPVPVHAGGRYHKNTVISVLAERGYEKLHVVHRLDAVTSGLLVFAKESYSANQLKDMFIYGLVKKSYEAIVYGVPEVDEIVVSANIKRRKGLEFMCSDDDDSREAVTEFQVLQRGPYWARVACSPVTGRTHQIRLHLRRWGYPIWDDPLYGPHSMLDFNSCKSDRVEVHPPRVSEVSNRLMPGNYQQGSYGEAAYSPQMQNRAISLVSMKIAFSE